MVNSPIPISCHEPAFRARVLTGYPRQRTVWCVTPVPVFLPVNQFDHFYLGGEHITALRSRQSGALGGSELRQPEEWLGSTVTRFGQAQHGITTLPDGSSLQAVVLADPEAWLGPAHVARYGSNPALLVKLLDAGERLPVHVHPTKRFARDHLGCDYGKTEAWVVLETPPDGASVWVGCKHDVDPVDLRGLVDAQNKSGLVALLNEIIVHPGDAIVVPSGTPHCTGAGAFVLELQEPTDFSVLLEWEGFALDGPAEGHLGLGFDQALQCVHRHAFSADYLASLVRRNGQHARLGTYNVMPSAADPYFRTLRVRTTLHTNYTSQVEASFAIVLVTEGSGFLNGRFGSLATKRGDALLIPYAAGDFSFSGDVTALVSLPPAPDTPDAQEWDA
jgi:mannose-6-phosphate isomerase